MGQIGDVYKMALIVSVFCFCFCFYIESNHIEVLFQLFFSASLKGGPIISLSESI